VERLSNDGCGCDRGVDAEIDSFQINVKFQSSNDKLNPKFKCQKKNIKKIFGI
jgi:hypothetical protein